MASPSIGGGTTRHVTVLVPTRNEAGNVAPLLTRLGAALRGVDAEVLFVDDSDDDTPAEVLRTGKLSALPVRLLHRVGDERRGGLGGAVHAGLRASSGRWVVVMDGDLQHPPETVPELLRAGTDADVVVASRHVGGGSNQGLGGWSRVAVSGSATTLAKLAFPRCLHGTSDPMSGFFAVRREALDLAALRPDGFKILLEVLVRSGKLRVAEVGFTFADRLNGESKASFREGLRYLRALARLRASTKRARALAFAAVGASGIVVNLALVLLLASGLGLHYLWAAALATQGSSTWNSLLTEHLVFADRAEPGGRRQRLVRSWLLNNAALLLRLPLLALLVDGAQMAVLPATFITLLAAFAGRFSVTDRLIYAPGGSVTATTERKEKKEPVDVVVDLTDRPTKLSVPQHVRYLPHRYNVPGLATIGSDVPLRELEWFRASSVGRDVDIAVRIGAVGGSPRRRARMTQHVGPAGVAYEEHLGRLGANFSVELGDRIEVVAGPLLARSPHVLYTNVIEALLRFQAVSRGRMLLHSACLEIGGRGLLLSARTDTGKTGTVLKMLREHGARFLSDDMTILETDGTARCFPKPLTISQHTLHALGINDLSKAEWRKLRVQSRLHSKEGRAFGTFLAEHNLPIMGTNALTQIMIPPPKYDVRRLLECEIVEEVGVTDLFVIERGTPGLESMDEAQVLQELIENTDDAYGFPPFRYFAPALVFGEDDYLTLRAKEQAILGKALQGIRGRRMVSDSFSWAQDISALLDAPRSERENADQATVQAIRSYLGDQRDGSELLTGTVD
jgi:glycosyltransferase involved in cell wall biosynthesis